MNKESIRDGKYLCEIINPSDSYTLRTDDFELACVAIAILGSGNFGLRCPKTKKESPVLFGWDDFFEKCGIKDIGKYIEDKREAIAKVFGSVLIGSMESRNDVEEIAKLKPEKELKEWLKGRHDRMRSSMNDIGGRAWQLAEHYSQVEEINKG